MIKSKTKKHFEKVLLLYIQIKEDEYEKDTNTA